MRMKLPVITYLFSSTLSALGNAIAAVALPLLLLAATGSALGAGVLAVATAVPSVLAGVLGGALIDRMDRRVASAIADVVSALALLALPIVDAIAGLELGWFVLFGILGAIGDVPGWPRGRRSRRRSPAPPRCRSSGSSDCARPDRRSRSWSAPGSPPCW